ncbi:hypothetical protein [Pseudomonas sp. MGal98]|uniref:hypothetical protein n=1 Tax=Pseudomonas sp. MGal98 TaxID=3162460 RepID=UPI0032EF30F5
MAEQTLDGMSDADIAARYWADKEWKTYAVDIQTDAPSKPTYKRTVYVRARKAADAEAWTRKNRTLLNTPKRCWMRARLAGPRELGATLAA